MYKPAFLKHDGSSSSSGTVPGPGVGGYATPSQSVLGCPFTRCKAHSRPVHHVVTPLISWSSSSSLPWYHAFDQVSLDAFVPHHMTKIAQFSVFCTTRNSSRFTPASLSTFSFDKRLVQLTRIIRLSDHISNAFSRFSLVFDTVHVSTPYSRVYHTQHFNSLKRDESGNRRHGGDIN